MVIATEAEDRLLREEITSLIFAIVYFSHSGAVTVAAAQSTSAFQDVLLVTFVVQ